MREESLRHDLGGTELIPSNENEDMRSVLNRDDRQFRRHAGRMRAKRTLVKYIPSSQAESPPPITANGLLRKMGTAPSQTAQALIPDCQYVSSPGRFNRRAEAPVAMITESAVSGAASSAPSRQYLNGRLERSGVSVGGSAGRNEQEYERLTNFGNGFGVNLRAEADGLGAEEIHHLGTSDSVGETGAGGGESQSREKARGVQGRGVQVLDVGGGGELSSGGESVGEHSLGRARE